jgi:membrane-bound lytic murein transglycosylase A
MRSVYRVLAAVIAMTGAELWEWQHSDALAGPRLKVEKTKVDFAALDGWEKDDHRAAFATFRKSCAKVLSKHDDKDEEPTAGLAGVCRIAVMLPEKLSEHDAKLFFEQNFDPHLVKRPQTGALLTGYFEPEVKGSLKQTSHFNTPIYAKPDDLVLLTRVANKGGTTLPADLTAGRQVPEGLVPYYTRQEIEQGVLKGRGLEIAYLATPYEAFVMQIQGSGLIRLPDGKGLRIGFAAKNGHPYTSVGKTMIDRGLIQAHAASMQSIMSWMQVNKKVGQELMWENKSYPFFRVLSTSEASDGPQGAMQLGLAPGRSLAVDPRYHELGQPIWVAAPGMKDPAGKPLARLLVAQDTGSAIKGTVRGDIFWGSGDAAGKIAGVTKQVCDFYVLMPK